MKEGIIFANQILILRPPLNFLRSPFENTPPLLDLKNSLFCVYDATTGASFEISQGGLKDTLADPALSIVLIVIFKFFILVCF